MHRFLSAVLLLVASLPALADVVAKPGELVVIEAPVKGDVAWLYDARDFDAKHSFTVNGKLILTTAKPGVYSVSYVAWDEKKIGQILVTFSGTPVPPVPPDPPPDPPPPVDALTASLQAAWKTETQRDPQASAFIAAACRQAAQVTVPAVTTWDQLLATLSKVITDKIGPATTTLPNVRQAIRVYLNSVFPKAPGTPMDAAGRVLAVEHLNKLAAALETLK
jgi:hypothetical protein